MDVNPRKIPRQARACATVEAIIVATAQLLTEQGFETLTTARAAERAGVSVGSLYQYFPNKQALAAAVVDHYGEKFATTFVRAIEEGSRGTLRESVGAMIHAALVSHPHGPELHRTLIEVARRVARDEKNAEISSRIARTIEKILAGHREEIAPDLDLADAAALVETVLETVAHRAVEGHPVSIAGDMAGQCRRLILAYLTSPARG
ncbi:TetR/AcrR family transcriptional regulator [Mesorhizobium sp. L-8-3]|uniref:TetR/AcrR family transcriptional regulator n=1 Tax=Mesorhizobium sp. L-8-3 TaxID=2744522 RepID=UPI001925E058|nr:TetR/AcrR family transcriptional regulator [Mesorhizobium sp. L-8-3]BCH20386.1 TetR family transcriptional regulator [Mesorhizobium sp. L-8-3]